MEISLLFSLDAASKSVSTQLMPMEVISFVDCAGVNVCGHTTDGAISKYFVSGV